MGYNRRDLGPWETQYCAYSTVFLGKDNLDEGDKIILPESALVALGTHIHSFVYTLVAFLLTLCLSHTHAHTHSHTYIHTYSLAHIFSFFPSLTFYSSLGHRNVEYPMLFEIRNISLGKVSHCGVMEFTAEEGKCYMPYWMMNNLVLQEGYHTY
jgi:hypothetical protein